MIKRKGCTVEPPNKGHFVANSCMFPADAKCIHNGIQSFVCANSEKMKLNLRSHLSQQIERFISISVSPSREQPVTSTWAPMSPHECRVDSAPSEFSVSMYCTVIQWNLR